MTVIVTASVNMQDIIVNADTWSMARRNVLDGSTKVGKK